jgi:hypothetical protein
LGPGEILIQQGETALKAHDADRAHELFQKAAAYMNELNPQTAQRLQEHLQSLPVRKSARKYEQGAETPRRDRRSLKEVYKQECLNCLVQSRSVQDVKSLEKVSKPATVHLSERIKRQQELADKAWQLIQEERQALGKDKRVEARELRERLEAVEGELWQTFESRVVRSVAFSGLRFWPQRVSPQVAFVGPDGMGVQWDVTAPGRFDSKPLVAPSRQDFVPGYTYRLKLSNIAGRAGVELYPTLEIAPVLPRTEVFLAHNPIPIQFTEENFDEVLSGHFVTKVIYLPHPEFLELGLPGIENLYSRRLDLEADPIIEADCRGTIVAIVRLGAKDMETPSQVRDVPPTLPLHASSSSGPPLPMIPAFTVSVPSQDPQIEQPRNHVQQPRREVDRPKGLIKLPKAVPAVLPTLTWPSDTKSAPLPGTPRTEALPK